MNLPNRLTLARLVLTVIFVAVTSAGVPWAYTTGLVLFVIASITDWLDGRIARQRGLVTPFGQLMDPLADKVLLAAAFVMLLEERLIPGWLVIAVLAREFLVTGLRLVASSRGAVLAADRFGKQKTVWQIVTAGYLLTWLAASRETPLAWAENLFHIPGIGFSVLHPVLLGVTLLATLGSGLLYFWRNRRLVLEVM